VGGVCYHVINRGNGRAEVFHKEADYAPFVKVMADGQERGVMPVLACCLMPNHFHLVVGPRNDGDLSRWMQWLMTAHVRRYHRHYGTSGHVWQRRFPLTRGNWIAAPSLSQRERPRVKASRPSPSSRTTAC
jgi:putative transposase